MGVQALVLGVLTVTGAVRLWEIGVLAALLGLNNAFENPARQSFMLEMVGPENLRNAVSLNSVLVNVARAIGPAVAGMLIATVGDGVCFLVNAASFVAVVASLLHAGPQRDPSERADGPRAGPAARGAALRRPHARARHAAADDGARRLPGLRVPGDAAGDGAPGLHVGATGYGFMTAAMGVGAVVGGLFVAARGRTGLPPLVLAASGFGVVLAFAALAPNLGVELVALALVGGASISFMSTGNTTLQLDRGAGDARARDVAVVRRLPGLDADRRPDRRLGDGSGRRARRARGRRRHLPARGGARAARAAPPAPGRGALEARARRALARRPAGRLAVTVAG